MNISNIWLFYRLEAFEYYLRYISSTWRWVSNFMVLTALGLQCLLEFDFSCFWSSYVIFKWCLFLSMNDQNIQINVFMWFLKSKANNWRDGSCWGWTYTWLAQDSLPDKCLKCFEQMKQSGLRSDDAVYHCLTTPLFSRAAVGEDYTLWWESKTLKTWWSLVWLLICELQFISSNCLRTKVRGLI